MPLLAAGLKKSSLKELRAAIPAMLDTASVPGLSFAVIENGRVSAAEGFGDVTASTLFDLASLSKPVFTHAALQLVDERKLELDRTLVSYGIPLEDEKAKTVTVRHILSHSSGFPNWRFKPDEKLVPAFSPGSAFRYSGEGFTLLQRVVEEIAGRGLGEFVRERVLEPLGMKASTFGWPPDGAKSMATPHTRRGEPIAEPSRLARAGWAEKARTQGRGVDSWRYADMMEAGREFNKGQLPVMMWPNAAASLVGTPSDYGLFVGAALKRRDARQAQVKVKGPLSWGLGWGLESSAGRKYLWHWGDNPGFKSFVVVDTVSGDGVAVATNGDGGMRVYERVIRHVTGRDHPAFLWI